MQSHAFTMDGGYKWEYTPFSTSTSETKATSLNAKSERTSCLSYEVQTGIL